jgi:hypothetical protein
VTPPQHQHPSPTSPQPNKSLCRHGPSLHSRVGYTVIMMTANVKKNAHSCRGTQGPARCSSRVKAPTSGGSSTSPSSMLLSRSITNRALVCLLNPCRCSITTAQQARKGRVRRLGKGAALHMPVVAGRLAANGKLGKCSDKTPLALCVAATRHAWAQHSALGHGDDVPFLAPSASWHCKPQRRLYPACHTWAA